MTIPRHRTVAKSKEVKREITHKFEFRRADLLRLLRLPEDTKLSVTDGGPDGIVVSAECTETK